MGLPGQELIIVLDFGGQYSHLIARRIRELKVFCEILPSSTSIEKIREKKPQGLVFSGGPSSIYLDQAPVCDPAIFELGIPVLGIGYGMQLMAGMLGGRVSPKDHGEYGETELITLDSRDVLSALGPVEQCWMGPGDRVESVPPGFVVTARTARTPVAAMAQPDKHIYALQFHPEVIHTARGQDILQDFLYNVCGCRGLWTMASFLEGAIAEIRRQVGSRKVLCALSGGVDSSVAAVMTQKAVGDQLTCVFVDHGLLRRDEAGQVQKTFREKFKINLVFVDARKRFLGKLAGVTDPEQKRKVIGEEFIRVFEDEAAKLGDIDFLVQGTLYPDVVESGTATAAVVKSHHNVGCLPQDMRFELVEPLRWLFKDEVRLLGQEMGLPEEVIWRQPFPGPGMAVRILGEITQEKVDLVQAADAIVEQEIRKAGLYRQIWQSFAVLPDMRSVGVLDGKRTYTHTVVIRAVNSVDAMTADWVRLPYEVLEAISSRIVNEIKEINRVAYDITGKPPATIEWE
ncbi:MAG: glutamine-hydrolyzing GMP synthase [Peptococcaceae bacterium]|nr:glutamine-hydrolyzing GMP synthase [Peptococcaceae bacterium]